MSKRLPESDSKVYICQILECLFYLHSLNIVHQDLKLDNILVCSNKRVKLIDFGFSNYTFNEN